MRLMEAVEKLVGSPTIRNVVLCKDGYLHVKLVKSLEVEDLLYIVGLLRSLGFRPITVTSGPEGLVIIAMASE